jgi:hypothetical protein
VGGVRKWQFLLIYSSIYADVGGTQGFIEILGFMVIFDENQGVSDLSKYEFLCPIYMSKSSSF